MAEDLSIKVKVDPDVSGVQEKLNKSNRLKLNVKVDIDKDSDIQKQIENLANKKFNIKVSVNPDTNGLQTKLNQISKNLKLNLNIADDNEFTKKLDNLSSKLNSAASTMQTAVNTKVGNSFKITAKTISSVSSLFGELENKISKVGDTTNKAKLEAQLDSLKKSYNDFLENGSTSAVDFSNITQGLANIKAECNSVIAVEKNLAQQQKEAGEAAKNSADKATEAMKKQASVADSLYQNLLKQNKNIPYGLESLVNQETFKNMNSAFANASQAKTAFELNGSVENLQYYQKAIESLSVSVKLFVEELNNAQRTSQNAFGNLANYATTIEKKANSLKQAYTKSGMKDSGIEEVISQLESASNRMNLINSDFENGTASYDSVVALFDEMAAASEKAGIKINSLSDLMEVLRRNYNNAFDSVRTFNQETQNLESSQSLQKRLSNLQYTITRYVESNKKIQGNKDIMASYDSIVSSISQAQKSKDISYLNQTLSKQSAAVAKLKQKVQELGLEGKTVSQVFQDLFGQHFNTMIAMGALHLMQNSLRQVYQNVLDIDTAMTELKKVTDETSESYAAFLDRSASTAKELGADVSDLINTTADWARLGYNVEDSEQLARVSTLYKNVGDSIDSASQASEYLISTLKGFNLQASDAQHVLDAINAVSNTQPISAQGLGEIMQRSSAAMSAANNTLEETIALGTAMNSVLQDAEKTGTTLKTVSMYLRATKTELEDAGESTEGMAESTSELRQELLALTHGKVDIQLDED